MRTLPSAVWTAGCLLGVVSEGLASDQEPYLAAADLGVGVAFLTAGLLAWRNRRRHLLPLLFSATGLGWCLGTLAQSEVGFLAGVGTALLYSHRGPLAHLLLAYPAGRLCSRRDRVVVGAAYVDGLVVPIAQIDALTIVLVGAIVIGGALGLRGSPAEMRRARALATAAAALVGAPLVLDSLLPVSEGTLLLTYEAALTVVAISLALGLLADRLGRAAVTDLVVELGAAPRSGTLREALARALGDTSLDVGFWVGHSLVDAEGAPMSLPAGDAGQAVTRVDRNGHAVALIVHDAAVTGDHALANAVDTAARLAASNARLQAELRAQVRELERSRRRAVEAGDAQRSRLERRLRHAADVHLEEMRLALSRARPGAAGEVADAVAVVERELDQAVVELHELARGIHPHALTEDGLAAALDELAATAPVSVDVAAPDDRFAPAIEVAAYFVCAEALANVAKHGEAAHARVEVRHDNGQLMVLVADKGVGGADPVRGSGLRGLADRVHAVGGRFSVRSPVSGGTTILAEIPIEEGS